MEWLKSTKLLVTMSAMSMAFIGNLLGTINGESLAAILIGVSGTFVAGKWAEYKNMAS
jgi:hypothetical protein